MEPVAFKLVRLAHGARNRIEGREESVLQGYAQERRQVVMPGVDWATAAALSNTNAGLRVPVMIQAWEEDPATEMQHKVRKEITVEVIEVQKLMTRNLHGVELPAGLGQHGEGDAVDMQRRSDFALAATGFAVLIHESWRSLGHLVRYFDLIEKNEAPDTPLLEWLVMMGAVDTQVVIKLIDTFSQPQLSGRTPVVLDEEDRARLKAAVDVRLQVEAEEVTRKREEG